MNYLFVFLFIVLMSSCTPICPSNQYESIMIMRVGGCDAHGYCGVSYSNGTSGLLAYPIAGESISVCKR